MLYKIIYYFLLLQINLFKLCNFSTILQYFLINHENVFFLLSNYLIKIYIKTDKSTNFQ